ncbi:hypothetical protein PANDA_012663 [Ailuropoda melanoleuca]|uniref:Chemokine interleukin-8-like domain-containing protein n=1 Tax=Ailuropoda melanoleuca TaxID=9646 RepID=D2HM86_AILME|nr:hypothetical protein PANDA_012663 [Ailuropoda melanoleuca]
MKSFPVGFLVLLIFILNVHRGIATRGSDVAKFCCFQYSHKILPWKWVHSYKFTRNSCSQQAVITRRLSSAEGSLGLRKKRTFKKDVSIKI